MKDLNPPYPVASISAFVLAMGTLVCSAVLEARTPEPKDRETVWTEWIADTYGAEDEFICFDGSRADVVSDTLAVEVEWASKWKESIGQALLYGTLTSREPAVILLFKTGDQREQEGALRCKLACQSIGLKMSQLDTRKSDLAPLTKLFGTPPVNTAPDEGEVTRDVPGKRKSGCSEACECGPDCDCDPCDCGKDRSELPKKVPPGFYGETEGESQLDSSGNYDSFGISG